LIAPTIGSIQQQEPVPESEPSERTEIKILYDENNLIFGIVCYDTTPSAIVGTQMARDADLEADDRVAILLDPFFDQRNGFLFEINPVGARADGQVSNNGFQASRNWDGIWEAEARIAPEGWVLEVAIPFKTAPIQAGSAT